MGLRFSTGAAALLVAVSAWTGCSGDPSPLGGPYGGTANMPSPSNANSQLGSGDDSGPASSSSSSSSSGGSASSSGGGGNGSSGSSNGSTSSSGGHVSSTSSSSSSSGFFGSTTSSSSSSGSGTTSSSSSGGPAVTPTWSQLYTKYLASGTIGNCSPCHSSIATPSTCYSWLQTKSMVGGANPVLATSAGSCLSWYGGNMPPFGPQSAAAVADFTAWGKAGGLNN